jgi:hypothetical protein
VQHYLVQSAEGNFQTREEEKLVDGEAGDGRGRAAGMADADQQGAAEEQQQGMGEAELQGMAEVEHWSCRSSWMEEKQG